MGIGSASVLTREWGSRWLDSRDHLASVRDDKSRFRVHVLPFWGERHIEELCEEDARNLVEDLDRKIRQGSMAWKTARHVWTLVRSMFKDARSSKRSELRRRRDDPTDGVRGPDRGPVKAKPYLYPDELLALVACKRLSRRRRRLYALLVYTYLRAGELEALRWEDVDLARGVLHVHRAVDRVRHGRERWTKGRAARRIPIHPHVLPLLQAMRDELDAQQSEYVVDMPSRSAMGRKLRGHLRAAGVRRADLFAQDETRQPITVHCLRGTGITWEAVRGTEALKIQHRAGHRSFETTLQYIREAENLEEVAFGEPFPRLPEELITGKAEEQTGPFVTCVGGADGTRNREPLPCAGLTGLPEPRPCPHMEGKSDDRREIRMGARVPWGARASMAKKPHGRR